MNELGFEKRMIFFTIDTIKHEASQDGSFICRIIEPNREGSRRNPKNGEDAPKLPSQYRTFPYFWEKSRTRSQNNRRFARKWPETEGLDRSDRGIGANSVRTRRNRGGRRVKVGAAEVVEIEIKLDEQLSI